MEACILKPKSWGNSLGLVIPKSVVEKERIREGREVEVFIRGGSSRPGDTFGILKDRDLSGQECKDMCRKELWGIE